MAIDQKIYRSPAEKRDIALLAINLNLAMSAIHAALFNISQKANVDITSDLTLLDKADANIAELLDEMTGWNK